MTIGIVNATQALEWIRNRQFKQLRDSQITKNFTWGEAFVHRTDNQIKDAKYGVNLAILVNIVGMAEKMERVRAYLGNRAIRITSWWRDAVSNQAVGGRSGSFHLLGLAVDFTVVGLTVASVQKQLKGWWESGLGYGHTFTHLDDRGYFVRFNY